MSLQSISLKNELVKNNSRLFRYSYDELFYLYNYFMRNKTGDQSELHQQIIHSEIVLSRYNNLIHKTIFTKNIEKVLERLHLTMENAAGRYFDSAKEEEKFFKELYQLYDYMQEIYDNDKRDISDLELKNIVERLNTIESDLFLQEQ